MIFRSSVRTWCALVVATWVGLSRAAVVENGALSVSVDGAGGITVVDRSAGRRWQATAVGTSTAVTLTDFVCATNVIRCTVRQSDLGPVRAMLTLEGRELAVRLEAPPEMPLPKPLVWPYPFASEAGDRLLLTKACGWTVDVRPEKSAIPVFDRDQPFYQYRNRMGCWGHYAERVAADGSLEQGAGMLVIVETPEDALYNARARANGLRAVNIGWRGEWERFGYARSVRYCFFARATPGTLAARYRREMECRGYRVTFREKARRNPRLAEALTRLKGAPDVWYWSTNANRSAVARDLRANGMRKFLFSTVTRRDLGVWVTPEEVRELAKMPEVLCSEYDIYVDTLEPAYWDKVDCLRPHWPLDVWANGDYQTDARGVPLRGWKVALKTDPAKPVIGCLRLCERQAPVYARQRIAKRQAEAPFGARFFDVTGTSTAECRHPNHPLTRRESARARRELIGVAGAEFGLVTGTEDGFECLVPTCDYFEGGFSSSTGRLSGREMWKTFEPPAQVERGLDPTQRCPFFDLVFHDCAVNCWYWSDYNNRFPALWWKYDLLNAVVGTPPMYLFTEERYAACRQRIGETAERTVRTARETADCLLLEYRWLTSDRLVQESEFSNGLRVVANFSDKPFTLPDGRIVPPHDHIRSREPERAISVGGCGPTGGSCDGRGRARPSAVSLRSAVRGPGGRDGDGGSRGARSLPWVWIGVCGSRRRAIPTDDGRARAPRGPDGCLNDAAIQIPFRG